MSIRKTWLLGLTLILAGPSNILPAQDHYTITDETEEIYWLITELRFEEASKRIAVEQKKDPHNLFLLHLENYIDFFTLIINENPEELDELEKYKKIRFKKLENGNSDDPYFRLLQAELLMQWGIAHLKFENYYAAVRETQRAYRLLRENNRLFPEFKLNNKGMAMVHAVIGTIPHNYQYLVKWFTGMEGDITRSLEEMEELIAYCEKEEHLFLSEAYVINSFIELYINNSPDKAWELINTAKLDPIASPIACFVMAIIAQRSERTNEAISLLENTQIKKDQHPFHFLEFMLGLNKLRKLDPEAKYHLLRFVRRFTGQNYLKEAYQLLAWYSLVIENNEDLARYYYYECTQKGSQVVDEDKSAYREAISGKLPDPEFLKIRLLFDGAFYQVALSLMLNKKEFLQLRNLLEYHYRMGRIHQNLGNDTMALDHYSMVSTMPTARNSYQACNSALQTGIIYEKQGLTAKARVGFKQCLELNPDKYKTSLHQKAKAGLERLKNTKAP